MKNKKIQNKKYDSLGIWSFILMLLGAIFMLGVFLSFWFLVYDLWRIFAWISVILFVFSIVFGIFALIKGKKRIFSIIGLVMSAILLYIELFFIYLLNFFIEEFIKLI